MNASDHTISLPDSLIGYVKNHENLTRLLMNIPSRHGDTSAYQQLVKTPPNTVASMYHVETRNAEPTDSVINSFGKAQQMIYELAKGFKEDGRVFFLEHPQVLLPFATLPAVQNMSLLTPDNYAAEVSALLHDLFRRLFPGATFRKRKHAVVLNFDSKSLERAHTFCKFMKDDNYWSVYLNEKNPHLQELITKFHESYMSLISIPASEDYKNYFEYELGENKVLSSVKFILPDIHTIPKRNLRDNEGNEHHYLKVTQLDILIKFISRLAAFASYTVALSSAYPVLKAQAADQHERISLEEAGKNKMAIDFIQTEFSSRVVTVPQERIDALSDDLKEYVLASITDDNRMFLPLTSRGFKNYGAHHIYVVNSQSTSHTLWTPLPPINGGYSVDLSNGDQSYNYQGISEQTSYIVDSPRSTHGKSPHVFNNLLYTALHAPFYNTLLLEQCQNYDLSSELKQLMINSLFPLPDLSYRRGTGFYEELDVFVKDLLFESN